jgi:hypothetical protein
VAAGRSASADGDSDGNRGASDAWIVRLDSDGGVVWKRTFGGSDVDYASSVAETADGGFFAAGATRSGDGDFREASGDLSAWAARLDPDGGLLWLKVFGGDVGWEAKAVLEVHDGGFLVMGEVDSPEDGCPDGGPCGNLMVVRLDPDGGTLRVRRPRARATLPGNAAVGIPGGEAAMAYEMYSRDGSPEARVTRAGREGRHLWTRTVASDAASYALATVGKGGSGGFVGAGEASRAPEPGGAAGRRPWIFRLNPDGALLWEALPLGGASGEFRGVAVADGGFFAVGAAENLAGDGAGHYDILAAFADSGGAALWTLALGGSGMDWASSAAAPPGGALYIGGTTNSSDGDFAWRARAGDRPDADGLVVKLARPAAAHGDE